MKMNGNNLQPRHWSIRWKLTCMAMLTTAVALFLAMSCIGVYEYVMLRDTIRTQQVMLCEIIGGNSTAAIAFNQADDATSILSTLRFNPSIRAACIYDGTGKLLAKYSASKDESGFAEHPQAEGSRFSANAIETSRTVKLDDKPVGTIFIRSDLRELNAHLSMYAWISSLILLVASVAGLLLIQRLQRSVSTPIVALAETARRVSQMNDYTLRAVKRGDDEIGELAEAFNHMLGGIRQRDDQINLHLTELRAARDQLEARVEKRTADLKHANQNLQAEMEQRQEAERKRAEMQANLVEASRKAGMADVATGVLHNVGNVLNSVNVSTQIVHDAVKGSHVANLAKAADLLHQHGHDMATFLVEDPKGKALPGFFCKLATALAQEHEEILKELDGLASNIGHIREIVAMQQSLSKVSGIATTVSLGDLIEDAIKINSAGLQRHQVSIERNFDPNLQIVTDRHKVLQILINLISNAKYAVGGCIEPVRKMRIEARIENKNLRIGVIDNGLGINPEQMTRIFAFGFTTKKNGHGFGLHSSALAAKELGGNLKAFSEGPGKGATFTLEVPIVMEEAHVS
jgi:two-component system, NtrC family, sensor kinase